MTNDDIKTYAEDAYEAYLAINNTTAFSTRGVPPECVSGFLGQTKLATEALAQALEDLGRNLGRSFAHFDISDEKGDAIGNAAIARKNMEQAAQLSRIMSGLLAAAETALTGQHITDAPTAGVQAG